MPHRSPLSTVYQPRLSKARLRSAYPRVQEVYVTADYEKKGNKNLIACSYAKIAEDLKPGSQILCADGSLVLSVVECYPEKKLVKCKAVNTAAIGVRSSP